MTDEAAEPEVADQPPATVPPTPQTQTFMDRVMGKFQLELGRLSGQLLVERAEREMEREQMTSIIEDLQTQLKDAGVVPKSDGGQPADAKAGDTPVTPIRQAARPGGAKKAAPRKRR